MIEEELVEIPLRGSRCRGLIAYPTAPRCEAIVAVGAPDPQLGGAIDNPVLLALLHGIADAGAAAVVWEYGEGEARDDERIATAAEEMREALRWLRHSLAAAPSNPRALLAGYSFGALVAAAAARCDEPVLCVAPPLKVGGSVIEEGRSAAVTLLLPDGDFSSPVEEREALVAKLGRRCARARLLRGEDHFLRSVLPLLRRVAGEWVRDQSPESIPQASSLL